MAAAVVAVATGQLDAWTLGPCQARELDADELIIIASVRVAKRSAALDTLVERRRQYGSSCFFAG